jgi:hypothetical protein
VVRGSRHGLLFLSVFMVGLVGHSPAMAQQLLDRVVARVNGVPIMLTDVNVALGLGIVEQPTSGDVQMAATAQLIERQLMLAEAARFSAPEPAAEAVEQEVARLEMRAGAQLDSLRAATGLDDRQIADHARETLRIQEYLNQRFGTIVQVSDAEVERYYRAHPEEFRRGAVLMPFDEAAPRARTQAASARRAMLIDQWLRDLRAQADVTLRP